ncbi:ParA family protein [Salinibacter altiplanensis]|uniref:ParA family protein n=1 Tax=Salinibacter altiplanensis TaxID=1803181 RepID=UPI000C9F07F2|nr:ParA family protein [Salinibacter altiplanensis]
MTSRSDKLLTLSISNLKGGAAKTVSSVAMAEIMGLSGASVLLVDLDPQGTASRWLAGRSNSATKLLTGGFDPGEDIDVAISSLGHGSGSRPPSMFESVSSGRVDMVTSNRSLEEATERRASDLSRRLEKLWNGAEGGYDIAILDTPPQAGRLVTAALLSTTGALVPVAAGRGAVDGLQHVLQYTRRIGGADVEATFACNVDARTYLDKQVAGNLIEQLGRVSEGGRACQHYVRSTVSVREAEAAGEPLGEYAADSTAWVDYMAIAHELSNGGVLPVGPDSAQIENPARLDHEDTT